VYACTVSVTEAKAEAVALAVAVNGSMLGSFYKTASYQSIVRKLLQRW
jgi:hypothetical protein